MFFGKKEQIIVAKFDVEPDLRIRIKNEDDKKVAIVSKDGEIRTLWEDKEIFPFKIYNDVVLTVETSTGRKFSRNIENGYVWNGANIIKAFWIAVGSQYNPEFLEPSMVHDYFLEHASDIYYNTLNANLSKPDFRRMTSLLFRYFLKDNGTGVVKSNFMSGLVDFWQKYWCSPSWRF